MSEVETEPIAPLVGEGEIPTDLLRPNWVAFVFAPIWALVYRVWSVLWLLLALIAIDIVVSNALLWIDESAWATSLDEVFFVFRVVWLLITVVVALYANRLLWSSVAKRQARGDTSRPLELHRYRTSLRSWTPFAGALLVLGLLGSIFALVEDRGGAWYLVLRVTAIVGLLVYDRVLASGSKANYGIEQNARR